MLILKKDLKYSMEGLASHADVWRVSRYTFHPPNACVGGYGGLGVTLDQPNIHHAINAGNLFYSYQTCFDCPYSSICTLETYFFLQAQLDKLRNNVIMRILLT